MTMPLQKRPSREVSSSKVPLDCAHGCYVLIEVDDRGKAEISEHFMVPCPAKEAHRHLMDGVIDDLLEEDESTDA